MFFNCILLTSFILVGITSGEDDHSTYPSIIWHPSNPVFACAEPKINVQIGDLVNLLCPTDDFKFYSSIVYENLYFLGTNYEQYKTCNATGMKRLLTCDGKTHVHTLPLREIKTSIGAIAFTKGETYYLIGTGFRVKENLGLTSNGSCRYTDKQGKYKLRLQLYVCKDSDTDCNICKSEACYYKDCGTSTCTPWLSDKQIYRKFSSTCYTYETRTCSNTLLSTSQSETRLVPVPCTGEHATNCSNWNPTGILSYDAATMQCFQHQMRTCKVSFHKSYNESQYLNMTCPNAYATCSNAISKHAQCYTVTTKHCQVNPFGMRFTETLFVERSCGGTVRRTTISPTFSTNIVSEYTNRNNTVSHSFLVPSSSHLSVKQHSTSTMTTRRSRGVQKTPEVPVVVVLAGKYVSKHEYQKVSKESASKNSTIGGLAIGIFIAFIGGIVVGLILVKWHGKKHDKVVVQHFNPGPLNTGSPYVSQASQNMAFSYESFERFSNLVSPTKPNQQQHNNNNNNNNNDTFCRRNEVDEQKEVREGGANGRRRSLSWTHCKDYADHRESAITRSQLKLI